jgi:hypothetical protein
MDGYQSVALFEEDFYYIKFYGEEFITNKYRLIVCIDIHGDMIYGT